MPKWEIVFYNRLKLATKTSKLETVLLVFALINFVVTGLSTLGSSVSLVCSAFTLPSQIKKQLEYYKNFSYPPSLKWYEYAQYAGPLEFCVGLLVLMMCSGIALVFAIFLLNGLLMGRANYLKAYFIYGAVVSSLSGIAVAFYGTCIGHNIGDEVTGPVALAVLWCYLLILYLVNQMYHKLVDLDRQHGHEMYENPLK